MTPAPTEQEIRLFVGKNADYYLKKWSPWLSGKSGGSGFNPAASWLAGLWLPYRKMYKITLIFYGVFIVETLLEYIVFGGILKHKESPIALNTIFTIACSVICGIYGNQWYYLHTCNKIAEVRRLNLGEESLTQALGNRGGTSWVTAIGFIMMFWIVLILIKHTLALLFFRT